MVGWGRERLTRLEVEHERLAAIQGASPDIAFARELHVVWQEADSLRQSLALWDAARAAGSSEWESAAHQRLRRLAEGAGLQESVEGADSEATAAPPKSPTNHVN